MIEAGHKVRGEPAVPLGEARPLGARAVLRHVRAGLGGILLCGLLAAGAVMGALSLVRPQYTSRVQMLVDPAGLHVLDGDIVDRSPRNDSGDSLVENQLRVVRSDSVLRRVVRELGLADDPEFVAPGWSDRLVARAETALGIAAADPGDPAETALDALRRKVAATRPEQTLVVNLYVETLDPQKSARIADAVAGAYFAEEASGRAGTVRRVAGSLAGGLPELEASIKDVEARILRYRRDHDLVTADGLTLGDQRLGALNREAAAAAIRTAEARESLDQARRARPAEAAAALPEMLRSRELGGLMQQYAELSRGTAEMTARLGARHPALAERAAQERGLRLQIQREKERIADNLQNEYDRAVASEAAVRADMAAAKAEVTGNDRAAVGLRELYRELAARRSVYEAQARRAREIGEQAQVDSTRVRVISPAVPAQTRSWPPPPGLVLPQALALGLVIGVGLALRRGRARDRRRAALAVLHGGPEGACARA